MSFISSIGTANPKHSIKQTEVVDFMIQAHGLNEQEAHDLKVLYRATGIEQRYTTIPDYSKTRGFDFFPDNEKLEPFPSTKKRGDWYRKHALGLSEQAVKNCLNEKIEKEKITHLITVSCTGMNAPGLDIELVECLGLNRNVERTAINFMGCYAAFNAIKVANHICKSQDANVLIVCVELCTLHFQKNKTDDNLLANALFGDGAAAVLVQSEPSGSSLSLEKFKCDLLPNAKDEMAWKIGDFGFEMKLSAYVPDAIESSIRPMVDQLKLDTGIREFDFFAIHPGGKRILSVVEEQLSIPKTSNAAAHYVLRNFGNMSSPTILLVFKEILDKLNSEDEGKSLLGFAFGPGLTLESLVAKVHVS